jgi:uncharacterized protein (TIGR00369 family)
MGTEAVNGVVLAGLFDLVIGTVGWLTRPETRSATVTLAMSFFRPTQGDRVVAEARLIRAGLNLVFASAEIANASGEVTARCEGTCAVALGKSDGQGIYERMRAGKAAP